MNAIQLQTSFFEDNSPTGLLRQEFILLHASTEKVRRGCFAKNEATKKELMKLFDALSKRLDIIEQHLNIRKNHEEDTFNDLPLFELAGV